MSAENINLTEAEWTVMECLWAKSPLSSREVTEQLEKSAGWNRSTTNTLLYRLEGKGAISTITKGRSKFFSAVLRREDAALHETEGFLERVYHGSLSMMVSSLTQKQALPKSEIDKLYAMLKDLEGGNSDG